MTVGFLSVAVADEQQAADRIRDFLVGEIGWKVAQDVNDTSTDRDVVYQSEGELDTANGLTRYIRIRGLSNTLVLYTYETFTSVSVNTGEVSEVTYGLITTEGDSQGFFLIVVADLERVVIYVETYNGVRYQGYVGRIKSYYTVYQHRYPNLVKGGQSTGFDWYTTTADRNAWMIGPEGVQAHYYGIEPLSNTGLIAGQSSDRNGSMTLSAPVLVRDDVDPDKSELVGEPRGVYRVPRETSQHNMFVLIDGSPYIVFENNSVPMAVGPVAASGTGVPRLQTDLIS